MEIPHFVSIQGGKPLCWVTHSSCCDLLWEQPLLLPGMGFHRRQLTLQLIVWEVHQQNGFLVKNALSAKSDLWLKSSGPSWSFSIVILDLGPV